MRQSAATELNITSMLKASSASIVVTRTGSDFIFTSCTFFRAPIGIVAAFYAIFHVSNSKL